MASVADTTQIAADEFCLKTKFGTNLDQLCEFYGVPTTALDEEEISGKVSDSIEKDPEILVELAVTRAALSTLKEVGKPKLDFVSESQDEVLALRVFFGLDQKLVAGALDVPISRVELAEHLSIAGLQQHIDSEQTSPAPNNITTEMKPLDAKPDLAETQKFSSDDGIDYETLLTSSPSAETPPQEPVVELASAPNLTATKNTEKKKSKHRGMWLSIAGLAVVLFATGYFALATSDWFLNDSDDANRAAPAVSAQTKPGEVDEEPPTEPIAGIDLTPSPEPIGDGDGEVDESEPTTPETTAAPEEETTTTTATTVPVIKPVSVNGGFESNKVAALGWDSFPAIAGWTASRNIEIWATGHSGVESPAGQHHIELNSTGPNEMTTKIKVSPNSQLLWSLDHRGRDGTDVMKVVFQSDSGEEQSWVLETGQRWQTYQFEYSVPQDSGSVTVKLISVTGGSRANLLDNFSIALKP